MCQAYLPENDGKIRTAEFAEAFPFLREARHVISLVGGGGKTTLMFSLAKHFARSGFRTLVTTSTHIRKPADREYAADLPGVLSLWEEGHPAVIGAPAPGGKLALPDPGLLQECMRLADAVLIEADGAKRMPCKVPASHEPVILPETDIVIGILGLDALGRTLAEACFRREEAVKLLNIPGADAENHILTEADLARILSSPNGTRKNVGSRTYYAVLNKCDTIRKKEAGGRILAMLRENGITRGALTRLCHKEEELFL